MSQVPVDTWIDPAKEDLATAWLRPLVHTPSSKQSSRHSFDSTCVTSTHTSKINQKPIRLTKRSESLIEAEDRLIIQGWPHRDVPESILHRAPLEI